MIARYQLMQAGSGQRRLERNDYGLLVKFEDYERLRAALTDLLEAAVEIAMPDGIDYLISGEAVAEARKSLCTASAGEPLRKPDLSDPEQAALAVLEPEDGCFSGDGEPDANG